MVKYKAPGSVASCALVEYRVYRILRSALCRAVCSCRIQFYGSLQHVSVSVTLYRIHFHACCKRYVVKSGVYLYRKFSPVRYRVLSVAEVFFSALKPLKASADYPECRAVVRVQAEASAPLYLFAQYCADSLCASLPAVFPGSAFHLVQLGYLVLAQHARCYLFIQVIGLLAVSVLILFALLAAVCRIPLCAVVCFYLAPEILCSLLF